MKEIRIIIQDFKLSEVVDALEELPGVNGLTALSVRGFGRDRGRLGVETIAHGSIHHVPRTMLVLVVRDAAVDEVVRVAQEHAHTGNPGDGKIFVSPVEAAVRIRTGQRGEDAL